MVHRLLSRLSSKRAPHARASAADVSYDRDSYTGGWGDLDNDCISDRHEVLIQESLSPVDMSADVSFPSSRWAQDAPGPVAKDASWAEVAIVRYPVLRLLH